jgi:hypothetical protein
LLGLSPRTSGSRLMPWRWKQSRSNPLDLGTEH